MQHIFLPFLTLILLTPSICHAAIDPILLSLDEAVEQRKDIIHEKEQHIETLKQALTYSTGAGRYQLAYTIYEQYDSFNTDSALYYAQRCANYADEIGDSLRIQQAAILTAKCLAINGIYTAAEDILLSESERLYPENANLYYKTCTSLYIWKASFLTLPQEKQEAWDHIPAMREGIMATESDPVWLAQERAQMYMYTSPQRALQELLPVLDSISAEHNYVRFLANTVGNIYRALGQPDSALHYYAASAISDIQHAVMEHASLREVALLLYEKGDAESILRAYIYTNACVEDAQYCKARLRTIEIASDMPLILSAYQRTIIRSQRIRTAGIIALSSLSVILLLILIYAACTARRLTIARHQAIETAAQLQESNLNLTEQSRIRYAYVTQYMKECSDIIQHLDDYHQSLLHTATHGTPKDMFNAVKSTDSLDTTLREFYQHFDETFMGLFPDFITEVNTLLQPDKQFPTPDHNHLSTELRILALIRLGVTNSEDIARFLRCSVKTIQNYRASIRNRAVASRNSLEASIAGMR